MIATASADRTIRFWQPTIGRMVRYIRLASEPLSLVWSPDGKRVLVSCVDGHIRVVDPTNVKVVADQPAISGWAYSVAVYGEQMVAAGSNGEVVPLRVSD